MPLPKPRPDEGHEEFIDRCVSDANVQAEAEDADQAVAICESIWDDRSTRTKKEEEGMEEHTQPIVTDGPERRFTPVDELEIRAGEDGKPKGIAGTAAVYGTRTTIAEMFEEEILPGFFDAALEKGDIRGLFNHNPDLVLGRTKSGTLSLSSGKKGLDYDIPELPRARADVLEYVRRGDVTGNSFTFGVRPGGDRWIYPKDRTDGGSLPLRQLLPDGCDYLRDVGPVTFPAYEGTKVSARSVQLAEAEAAPEGACEECAAARAQLAERDATIAAQEEQIAQLKHLQSRTMELLGED